MSDTVLLELTEGQLVALASLLAQVLRTRQAEPFQTHLELLYESVTALINEGRL